MPAYTDVIIDIGLISVKKKKKKNHIVVTVTTMTSPAGRDIL